MGLEPGDAVDLDRPELAGLIDPHVDADVIQAAYGLGRVVG